MKKSPVISRTATVQKMLSSAAHAAFKAAKKKKPSKLLALEDDEPVQLELVEKQPECSTTKIVRGLVALLEDEPAIDLKDEQKSGKAGSKPVKPDLTPLPLSEPSPAGFFSITTLNSTQSRTIILAGLDRAWSELLCYVPHMGTTVHVKRDDLIPKQVVSDAINFLQSIK